MKLKVSNLLATFAAVFILGLTAQAQEDMPVVENPDPYHREFNLNEDKILIYDRSHSTTAKDSVQVLQRVVPGNKALKPDASKNKEAEDDALSFNFLYYMLQKFKLSDLIDQ
ncbi:MAG TPA: hypothetical protein PLR06_00560 [Cyclobacteriaceae bacterium]|nr:hypothetical protein [Cyclobacteriaceae bacterium]